MAYQSKRRKLTAEINVVPYIDVMLVLLIIFMVTSPFVTQGVDVDLPQTSTAQTAQELAKEKDSGAFIVVEIDKQGGLGLSVNNGDVSRGLSLQDILIRVKAELEINPQSPVLVGGDGRVAYAEIVLILDALSQAGVSSVGLMTEPLDS